MICSVRMESNLEFRWINGLIQISMQNIALEKTSGSCKYRKRLLLALFIHYWQLLKEKAYFGTL